MLVKDVLRSRDRTAACTVEGRMPANQLNISLCRVPGRDILLKSKLIVASEPELNAIFNEFSMFLSGQLSGARVVQWHQLTADNNYNRVP